MGYGLSYTKIGFFALATLPYAFKFLWSPLIDRLTLPFFGTFLGKRRGWLLFSQLSLMVSLWCLASIDISHNLVTTAFIVFGVSFFAATQDILLLTYQAEILARSTYGAGEAMSIFGYRMGMIVASAGALYLASSFSWGTVYVIMSMFVLVGIITTLFIAEPVVHPSVEAVLREEKARDYLHSHPRLRGWQARILSWCYGAIVCPFADLIQNKIWIPALLVIFFYKLGDNLIGTMSNLFYVDLGFSKIDIANASKIFGMWASIFGGFVGGMLINRLGMVRSLFWFALIHAVATLMFVVMSYVGNSLPFLYFSIALEHITGGMRTTALFAYQLTLCNVSYAATQLALMTSLVNLGRTSCASISGFLVDILGWTEFFFLASASSIPVLLLVLWLGKKANEPVFALKNMPKDVKLKPISRIQAIRGDKEEKYRATGSD